MNHTIIEHFSEADPRRYNRHLLIIVVIAPVGQMIGWRQPRDWFAEFLEIPHGIPSTTRSAAVLDAEQFRNIGWISA